MHAAELDTQDFLLPCPSASPTNRNLRCRLSGSLQLPTGGALYFDGGVIEVATPVIEIARQCTARAVRSLWDQIGFLRGQLDRWEVHERRSVRLQAFSCHVNISFELPREERGRNRTIQKLALLLTHLLPPAPSSRSRVADSGARQGLVSLRLSRAGRPGADALDRSAPRPRLVLTQGARLILGTAINPAILV